MTLASDLIHFFKQQHKRISVLNLAAQLSYRVLLAFIPFSMLLYNFINWFAADLNPKIFAGINILFPNIVNDLVETEHARQMAAATSLWTNLVFIFFLLYASIAAIRAFMLTINKVLGIPERRNYFVLWGMATLYLFIFLFLIICVVYLYILTQNLSIKLLENLGLTPFFINYWQIFSFVYIISIIILTLSLAYMHFPCIRIPFFSAMPGAIFAVFSWLAVLAFNRSFMGTYLSLNDFILSFEGPFLIIFTIYLLCLFLTLGPLINLFFIEKAGGFYEN